MKKILITLLVLLGLGCTAVVSCPDKQAHKDAIMAEVNEAVNDKLDPDKTDTTGLSQFFGSIGSGIAGFFIDKRLTVENYFVCSVGKISTPAGEEKYGESLTWQRLDTMVTCRIRIDRDLKYIEPDQRQQVMEFLTTASGKLMETFTPYSLKYSKK